jgi:Phosphopantetheine attachment site
MVPAAYVPMRRTPSNANGKLDRTKLRHLASHELTDEQWRQCSLANVTKRPCSQVLGTTSDSIGVDDSFFRLGGDSITAIWLVRAARSADISPSIVCLGSLACLAIPTSPNQTTAATEYKPFCYWTCLTRWLSWRRISLLIHFSRKTMSSMSCQRQISRAWQ